MFRKILCWLLRQEPLVEMENPAAKQFFTMGFDPDTQTFKKILFYEDTQKFEFEREEDDNTNARAVAAKVCNIL